MRRTIEEREELPVGTTFVVGEDLLFPIQVTYHGERKGRELYGQRSLCRTIPAADACPGKGYGKIIGGFACSCSTVTLLPSQYFFRRRSEIPPDEYEGETDGDKPNPEWE